MGTETLQVEVKICTFSFGVNFHFNYFVHLTGAVGCEAISSQYGPYCRKAGVGF